MSFETSSLATGLCFSALFATKKVATQVTALFYQKEIALSTLYYNKVEKEIENGESFALASICT